MILIEFLESSPFLLAMITSFSLGIAANLNPCVLPLYPGFLAFLANKPGIENKKRFTRISGLLVISGVLVFMLIVGLVTASLGLSINNFISVVSPIAFMILIFVGFLLILNVDFSKLGALVPHRNINTKGSPYRSAFLYGFFYGPIVIPCNAPLVFAVFAYSFGATSFIEKFSIFMAFGLGLGLPLLLLSLLSSARGSWLIKQFSTHQAFINRLAGTLLVILGIYELVYVFRIFG